MEHLWLEIEGRNKEQYIGTIYRSTRIMDTQQWLTHMESMLSDLTTSWEGLLIITGDMNIDLLKPSDSLAKKYNDLLYTFNLTQHVEKATRTTQVSETLIDHIISNDPKRVTYTNVLPCSNVSDHDGPYACLNIRAERFVPRYKIIRNERAFKEEDFIEDFSSLPFNILEISYDPEEKLEMFNKLILECIGCHAPLKRIKITRPPAPWLHDQEIEQLQNERSLLRHLAHSTKTADAWKAFRKVRNLLKTKIKEAKRSFINIALSSSKPKAVWRVIHRILNPCQQPLRFDVDELNDHFAGTSTRTAGASTIDTREDLMNFFGSIDSETPVEQQFTLRPITREEVLCEIKRIRLDTSTGPVPKLRIYYYHKLEYVNI